MTIFLANIALLYSSCNKDDAPEQLPDVIDSIVGSYRVFVMDILLPGIIPVDTIGYDTLLVTRTARDSFSIVGNVLYFDLPFQSPEDSSFVFQSLFDVNARYQYGTFFLYEDSIILIDQEFSFTQHSPAIYYTGRKILN